MPQHELTRINAHRRLHIGGRRIEHGGNAVRRDSAVEHDSTDELPTEMELAERGLELLEAQRQTSPGAGRLDPAVQLISPAFEEDVGGEVKGVEDFGVAGIAIGEGDQFNMTEFMYVRQSGVPPQERFIPLGPGPKHHPVADLSGPKRGSETPVGPVG